MEATIKKIKNHFLEGKPLSKIECIEKFNYINLGDVVFRLRKQGIQIQRKWIHTTNRKKYAVYFLNKNQTN